MWNGPVFDASDVTPNQAPGKHPLGTFDATVQNTELKPVENTPDAFYLKVTFQTNGGIISTNYNVRNPSADAVRIATEQLAALCWATGVMRIDMSQGAASLRGARLKIVVVDDAKDAKYSRVTRVLDPNGNEPGKPAQQGQPMQGQGGFGQPSQAQGGFGAGQPMPGNGGFAQPGQPMQGQPIQGQPVQQGGYGGGQPMQGNPAAAFGPQGGQQGQPMQGQGGNPNAAFGQPMQSQPNWAAPNGQAQR